MLVTKIEKLSKTRSKVYIEQEFAFVLYKGELRRYHIEEDKELSSKDHDVIMTEILPKRAKMRAMHLLARKVYTTAQLRTKLLQGLYPEPVVEEALEYVASFHYTDDLRYAAEYISCHENTRSRRRIEQDLMRKGIGAETLQAAWKQWEEQGGVQDEEEMIRDLLRKRHFDFQTTNPSEIRKHVGFLMRRGYAGEDIYKVLRSLPKTDFD